MTVVGGGGGVCLIFFGRVWGGWVCGYCLCVGLLFSVGVGVQLACVFMTVSTLPVLESTESYVIQTALRCDVA